ncbi:MAG: hypothetical protein NVSMB52_03580 [Chloroflexota bacterium]
MERGYGQTVSLEAIVAARESIQRPYRGEMTTGHADILSGSMAQEIRQLSWTPLRWSR